MPTLGQLKSATEISTSRKLSGPRRIGSYYKPIYAPGDGNGEAGWGAARFDVTHTMRNHSQFPGGALRYTSAGSAQTGVFIGTQQFSSDRNISCEFYLSMTIVSGTYAIMGLATSGDDSAYTSSENACFIVDNGSAWISRTSNDQSTKTDTTLDVSPAIDTRVTLRIDMTPYDCKFYINNVLKATHTTKIPTGSLALCAKCNNASGISIDVGYIKVWQDDTYDSDVSNTAGLVGFWPLREVSGTTATALVGSNGTYQSDYSTLNGLAGPFATEPARKGVYLDYDATRALTLSAAMSIPAAGSFECWFRSSGALGGNLYNANNGVSNGLQIEIGLGASGYAVAVQDVQDQHGVEFTQNVWYHLVVVWSSTTDIWSYYVNGVLKATRSVSDGVFPAASTASDINKFPHSGNGDSLEMYACALAIYNVILNLNTIQRHYSYGIMDGDRTLPTPGGSGTITTASVVDVSLTLNWTKATDNISAQTALSYIVYKSASSNISTVALAEANGTALNSYTLDIATFGVTGLVAETTYYFNVVVKDEVGNKAIYTTKSEITTA